MESFFFVLCLSFQVKKRKKQTQRKDFAANLYLLFNPLTVKFVILHSQKRFQMLSPQTEKCLNIVWVPGARRRRRALRTWDNNIETIFIKIPAAKELRQDNAYTKLCNFLWISWFYVLIVGCCGSLWAMLLVMPRCGSLWLVVARCGSLWFVVARCGSLCVVVVRCGSLWLVA